MDPTTITSLTVASAVIAVIPTVVLIVQYFHRRRCIEEQDPAQADTCLAVIEANASISELDLCHDTERPSGGTDNKVVEVEISEGRCAVEIEDREAEIPHLMLPPPVMDNSIIHSGAFAALDPSPPLTPPPTPNIRNPSHPEVHEFPAALAHI